MGEELEHHEERDDAGVGLREVAEVVVGGDLAGEERALLPDAVLDEGVPHPVHERDPARLLDRPGHGAARTDVVDHPAAGLLLQHRAGEERRDEVARHELADVVDEEAPVGVAVVRDPEVGALGAHPLDDERSVLGEQRVRLVVRERPVGLEEAADDVQLRQLVEHRRQHRPGHPVRSVDDDPQRPDRVPVDEGEDLGDEALPDVLRAHLATAHRLAEPGPRTAAHLLQPRVAPDGERPGTDDLHPGVLLRVVRRGDADAAVERELADRVVDHLGADHPEVEHVCAAVRRPLDHRRGHRRRREAHVPPDGDRPGPELLGVGSPDPVGPLLVELRGVDPPDVVRLEDLRVEHAADASRGGAVRMSSIAAGACRGARRRRASAAAQLVRRRIQRPEFMSLA